MDSRRRCARSRSASRDENIPAQPDPETLPHVHFAEADKLLSKAASLRCKAESLRKCVNEVEAQAEELEQSAATLQTIAQVAREHVQAELDSTLEFHDVVLNDFLASQENKKTVNDLSTSVEEGRAYIHEVVGLGERILAFRARKVEGRPEAAQAIGDDLRGLEIPDEDHQNLERTVSPSVPSTEPPLLNNESDEQEYGLGAFKASKRSEKKPKKRKRNDSEIEDIELADCTWVYTGPAPRTPEQDSTLTSPRESTNTEPRSRRQNHESSRTEKLPKGPRVACQSDAQVQGNNESKVEYIKRVIKAGKKARDAQMRTRQEKMARRLPEAPIKP